MCAPRQSSALAWSDARFDDEQRQKLATLLTTPDDTTLASLEDLRATPRRRRATAPSAPLRDRAAGTPDAAPRRPRRAGPWASRPLVGVRELDAAKPAALQALQEEALSSLGLHKPTANISGEKNIVIYLQLVRPGNGEAPTTLSGKVEYQVATIQRN